MSTKNLTHCLPQIITLPLFWMFIFLFYAYYWTWRRYAISPQNAWNLFPWESGIISGLNTINNVSVYLLMFFFIHGCRVRDVFYWVSFFLYISRFNWSVRILLRLRVIKHRKYTVILLVFWNERRPIENVLISYCVIPAPVCRLNLSKLYFS